MDHRAIGTPGAAGAAAAAGSALTPMIPWHRTPDNGTNGPTVAVLGLGHRIRIDDPEMDFTVPVLPTKGVGDMPALAQTRERR